jgi:hypothetical protein
MATTGPPPKRNAERRRRNKPNQPTDTVKVAGAVKVPRADSAWHPIAKAWYRSLKDSGQSKYYEPSDWQTARYVAELMTGVLSDDRPSSEMVKALTTLMASLCTTEGERRRVRMEIERQTEDGESATVTAMDAYRRASTS